MKTTHTPGPWVLNGALARIESHDVIREAIKKATE